MEIDLRDRYATTPEEVADSVRAFHEARGSWRTAVGNAPKYFVHLFENGEHKFGLSKMVAFKNISMADYLGRYRNTAYGNVTRKKVGKATMMEWVPYAALGGELKTTFDAWIGGFFENYDRNNANLISLNNDPNFVPKTRKVIETPEQLERRLANQRRAGEIGEHIALEFEKNRLSELKLGSFNVQHTAKINNAEGYDLYSIVGRGKTKEERFIEVKGSVGSPFDFYLTEHEREVLKALGNDAYLYLVKVHSLEKKTGEVVKTIQNPIQHIEDHGVLKPSVYKVILEE